MVLEKLDSNMQKKELGPHSYTRHKKKLKMDERPKHKTAIKILEEKTGNNLFDLVCSNFLLNMSPETRETKAKMNYCDLIKIKIFCTAKETISKTKRQLMEWGKIFANDISVKGLVSQIYRQLIKLTPKKQIIH